MAFLQHILTAFSLRRRAQTHIKHTQAQSWAHTNHPQTQPQPLTLITFVAKLTIHPMPALLAPGMAIMARGMAIMAIMAPTLALKPEADPVPDKSKSVSDKSKSVPDKSVPDNSKSSPV